MGAAKKIVTSDSHHFPKEEALMRQAPPAVLFPVLVLTLTACNSGSSVVATTTPEQKAIATPTTIPEAPPKFACPVKLTNSKMVQNGEMDVYTTVVNVSGSDITAIAFNAAHTDRFGDTWKPYKTVLTSEDTIRRGKSQSMHWEVLMEEPTGIHNAKPGLSELFVDKVAFSDGRVFHVGEIEGCDFMF